MSTPLSVEIERKVEAQLAFFRQGATIDIRKIVGEGVSEEAVLPPAQVNLICQQFSLPLSEGPTTLGHLISLLIEQRVNAHLRIVDQMEGSFGPGAVWVGGLGG